MQNEIVLPNKCFRSSQWANKSGLNRISIHSRFRKVFFLLIRAQQEHFRSNYREFHLRKSRSTMVLVSKQYLISASKQMELTRKSFG